MSPLSDYERNQNIYVELYFISKRFYLFYFQNVITILFRGKIHPQYHIPCKVLLEASDVG